MTWPLHRATDLQNEGLLLIEDGNHGEYRPRPDEFNLNGTAYIRAGDLRRDIDFGAASRINETALRRIRKGIGRPLDVVLTHKGTVGRVAIAGQHCPPFVLSPQTTFWRSLCSKRINSYFLRYVLESRSFQEQLREAQGSTDMAPYVSLTDQRKFLVPLPDLGTQLAIAAVLGALDDKIAANTALARTAEDLAVANASTAAGSCQLDQIASLDRRSVSPSSIGVDSVAHYSIPAFDVGQQPSHDAVVNIKSNKFLIDGQRVLVSKLNPRFPRVWAVDEKTGLPGLASTELLPLVSTHVPYRVLAAVLNEEEFGRRLEAQVAGTSGSHQRVKPADLMATQVADPRLLTQEQIGLIDQLMELGSQSRSENLTLAELRDMLLPALMSGQLRVKDAERQVEDAV